MESAIKGLGNIGLKEFEVVNTSTPVDPSAKRLTAKDFAKKIKIKIINWN